MINTFYLKISKYAFIIIQEIIRRRWRPLEEMCCFFGPYTEHTMKLYGETGLYLTDKSYYVV